MKLIQTLLVLAVFAVAMTSCAKKADPAAAAKALCGCNDKVAPIKAEMKDVPNIEDETAKIEKVKDIASRLKAATDESEACIKTNVAKYQKAFAKEEFKTSLLDAMKSNCPEVAALYSKFVN